MQQFVKTWSGQLVAHWANRTSVKCDIGKHQLKKKKKTEKKNIWRYNKDDIVEKLPAILKHLFEIRGWGCQQLTLPRQLSTFQAGESRHSWLKTGRERNAGKKRVSRAAPGMKTDWRYIEVFTIFSFPGGDPTPNCKNQTKLNTCQIGRTCQKMQKLFTDIWHLRKPSKRWLPKAYLPFFCPLKVGFSQKWGEKMSCSSQSAFLFLLLFYHSGGDVPVSI